VARVGVLALQGDFAAHRRALASLGVETLEVRRSRQLAELDALVIPGGESTTLLRLLGHEPEWWPALEAFHRDGRPLLGTCAGLILLAKEVTGPAQRSFGFLDVTVARNAYGRQIDSFETTGRWEDGRPLEMVFIRAPRITRVGDDVDVLARHDDVPVLVRQGRVLGASFHPELTADPGVHRELRSLIRTPAVV